MSEQKKSSDSPLFPLCGEEEDITLPSAGRSSTSPRSPGRCTMSSKSSMSGKESSKVKKVSAYLQGSGLGANLGMRLHLPTSSPSSSTPWARSDKLLGRGTAQGGREEGYSPRISPSSFNFKTCSLSAVEPGLPRCTAQLLNTICEEDKAGGVSQAGVCNTDNTEPREASAVGGVIPGDISAGIISPREGL